MSSSFPPPKRPKMEPFTIEEDEQEDKPTSSNIDKNPILEDEMRKEQEEAYVALIEHRTKEVEHNRNRVTYYKSQLEEAEKRLEQTKLQLARLRGVDKAKVPKNSPSQISKGSSQSRSLVKDDGNPKPGDVPCSAERKSRPQLVIPAVNPRTPQPTKIKEPETGSRPSPPIPSHANSLVKVKVEKSRREQPDEVQHKGTKRKLDQKEHKELISLVRSSPSPSMIRCQPGGCIMSSQHKRKFRSLELCPTNDKLFVTSALEGLVNLWQLQGKGSSASLLSSTDCLTTGRKWPEDIAWHPEGSSLFSVYYGDGTDPQISILNLNTTKGDERVRFLKERPHVKGKINSIVFMPWDETYFVTGGSDHYVVLWTERDGGDSWKPKILHRNLHSSAVMGVAGFQHKRMVLSVGADKKVFGYDLVADRLESKYTPDSKCMSVLTNPCDFNLFMVQTATPEKQLRLYDIRLRNTELHSFGWRQESSESQSAHIDQAWSPDGLYLTSGSADPVIHIFDIRYNSHKPSQSVKAHQKRVFKAAWHYAHPLLISISSDLNIGLHKII